MKIIILGAGQVGVTLAESLARESFDITVVDNDRSTLSALSSRLDIQTIEGWASHPETLRRAGASEADLLIAVTGSDEVNMIACQVCFSLFKTPRKIARVRAADYLDKEGFFSQENMPIDVLINPEQVVTENIHELLRHPGALQVLDFAEGLVQLVGMRAYQNGPLVGHAISYLREDMPNVDTRVAAIFRKGQSILPTANTVIEIGDEVFFIAARKDINTVMSELRKAERPYERVMIAGGGTTGELLAREIEKDYAVKIVEISEARAMQLAEKLGNAIVLNGDATDRNLMLQENIENCDAFCAVTNDDETNIMASLLAKRLGVREVITLISKADYVDLLQGSDIDVVLSRQQASTSSVLSHVRQVDVTEDHSLRRDAAEAIEAVAHGNSATSQVVGRAIDDIALPPGTTIGAVVRDGVVYIAHSDLKVMTDDHVILFLVDKSQVHEVENLFQVKRGFL